MARSARGLTWSAAVARAKVEVEVSPDVIRWVCARRGTTIEALEAKTKRPLSKWVSGEKRPTILQLEDFAATTLTPLGYLLLAEPPDEQPPIPHYRSSREHGSWRPSAELLEVEYAALRRQSWLSDHLAEQDLPPLPFVGSIDASVPHDEVAQAIRDVLSIGPSWAKDHRTWETAQSDLIAKAERAGIVVSVSGIVGNATQRPLDADEFRGFVLIDEYAPLIFVNGHDYKAAQMFTLAHELAHVWLGDSGSFQLRRLRPSDSSIERYCDSVAAEFLVPAAEFRQAWPELASAEDPFPALARRFKVSRIVVARRALDLGLMSRDAFFEFYRVHRAEGTRPKRPDATGGPNPFALQMRRVGRLIVGAVAEAVRDGSLSYHEAYDLTGARGSSFTKLVGRLEG